MHIPIPGVKKSYDRIMRPLSDFFHIKLKLLPNHVSCIGFLIGLVSVGIILAGFWQLGLIVMAFSLLFDGIDGNIARVYGLESKTGEKLELIFDRSLEALIFLAFAFINGINVGLVFLVIYSILLMTSLREKAKFDPGLKRVALFLGFILSFELIFNVVFFVHIGSFILQIAILDYVNQENGATTSQKVVQ
jgi:phosphatidylglycerophosphate synthase